MMLKAVVLVLFAGIIIFPQEKNTKEVVAKAGPIEITADEFIERYQLNPQLETHRKSQGEANKKVFLYGLLAEKLLALEAEELKRDTSETVRFFLKNFEKLFIRDELYRKEIKQRSKDYAANLLSFYLENSSRIFTKTIIQNNERDINNIHSLLVKGIPFDSLYKELTPQERDTITLFAGTLDNYTEQQLFGLPENSFSKPLQYNEHWVIFFIENKSDPVLSRSMGWEAEYKRLERAARDRAEAVYYKEYMEKFFPSKKIDASGILIHSLAGKINAILEDKGKKENDNYYFTSADVIKAVRNYDADTLHSVFIKMDYNSLTLKDFLMWLRTENFVLKENTFKNAVSLLNGKVKKYIEYELLAQEGYRQGLDKSENVIKNTKMWRDNYLYQLQLSLLSDSLMPDLGRYEFVKLAEIVNNDLEVMERVINELASGTDFNKLADEFSIEELDLSYRPVTSLGQLKDEVIRADVNEISGPVNTERGYIIFKVLDKKRSDDMPETKSAVRENGKLKNPFNPHISSLAGKYGITINEEVLAEIKSTNVNAVVFKYLGFGGRILAVPIINPVAEWITDYKEETQLNP
jgi:hypothetical protein